LHQRPQLLLAPSRLFAVAEDLVICLALHSTTMLGRLYLSSVVFVDSIVSDAFSSRLGRRRHDSALSGTQSLLDVVLSDGVARIDSQCLPLSPT
jgi:hypothetical protein